MPRVTLCNVEIQFTMFNVLVHSQSMRLPTRSTYKIEKVPTNDEITIQFPINMTVVALEAPQGRKIKNRE